MADRAASAPLELPPADPERDRCAIIEVARALNQVLATIDPHPGVALSAVATLLAVTIANGAKDDAAAQRLVAQVTGTLGAAVRVNRALMRPSPGKPAGTVAVGHG